MVLFCKRQREGEKDGKHGKRKMGAAGERWRSEKDKNRKEK
jgi:hypothetical protein